MKTVCVLESVSRANGGIFEAERRLQQTLRNDEKIDVAVVGLLDANTEADLAAWQPIVPAALPVRGPSLLGYAPAFAETLASAQADLGYVAGLWKYPAFAAHRWSRAARRPLMVAPHGMLDPWALRHSGWKKQLAARVFQDAQLREAACLRALCRAEAEAFRAYGLRNPVAIIPNGIDLPDLAAVDKKVVSPFPPGRKVLLYLGRIHPKKGLPALVAAWKEADAIRRDWVLAIAGWDQGGHEAELQRRATELGLKWAQAGTPEARAASVLFLGPQFGPAKAACYRACDAFILPSLSEGLPMVVLEAWAYGKPVLMTEACNLPEGFAAGAALRVDPESRSLTDSLNLVAGMTAEELQVVGGKGRALVAARFDWRKLASQMAAVYGWMLGGGAQPDGVETHTHYR